MGSSDSRRVPKFIVLTIMSLALAFADEAPLADENTVAAGDPEPQAATTAPKAKNSTSPAASSDKDLQVSIYPLFGWIPFFSSNYTVPPLPGGGGNVSIGGSSAVKITGALAFAGDVTYKKWLIEAEAMFAN